MVRVEQFGQRSPQCAIPSLPVLIETSVALLGLGNGSFGLQRTLLPTVTLAP